MARWRYNRGLDYLKTALLFVMVAIAAAYFSKLATQNHVGQPTVIDGDSVRLEGVEMRLIGIDAPELSQVCQREQEWACGRAARAHLFGLLTGGKAQCKGGDTDQYERLLVHCTVDGQDINAAMVRDGYAVSFGRYEALEREARAAGRGLWAGEFERPAQWRAAQRGDGGLEVEHASDWLHALGRRAMQWWQGDE